MLYIVILSRFSIYMIAFYFFWWPIYWYGIMYVISFLYTYFWLFILWKYCNKEKYPHLYALLNYQLDDVFMYLMLGVLLWWRLWDVFLYNRSYFNHHIREIVAVWKWGMSFVWWFIGVICAWLYIKIHNKLSNQECLLLFDYLAFLLPLWILLWRIANGLNQELYGKIVDLGNNIVKSNIDYLYNLKIIKIYNSIDQQWRRNTNLLEGFFEWCVLFIVHGIVFTKKILKDRITPWIISGFFCIFYSIVRFFLEPLRDNPDSEYIYGILKSQLLMISFFVLGLYLIMRKKLTK